MYSDLRGDIKGTRSACPLKVHHGNHQGMQASERHDPLDRRCTRAPRYNRSASGKYSSTRLLGFTSTEVASDLDQNSRRKAILRSLTIRSERPGGSCYCGASRPRQAATIAAGVRRHRIDVVRVAADRDAIVGVAAAPSTASKQPSVPSPQGASSTTCVFPSGSIPKPAISPRSLIKPALTNVRLEPEGTKAFKSVMRPFCQRNPRAGPSGPLTHGKELPTI